MDVEHFREFTVIARLESFSRAAEELNISQSALSKHILALERELGTQLLVRNSRNVTVSPAGAQILPMAAQIYELSNRIRVAAAKESSRAKAILRIASIPVMAQYDITGLLASYQKRCPEVVLEVAETEQHDLAAMLREGSCELAFTRISGKPEEDMEYLPLYEDNLVAVMHRDHPLAQLQEIPVLALKDEPLLFLDQRTGIYELCTGLCREAGFTPQVVYTGYRPENIVELAAQHMGIALLMRGHTDYVRSPQVACIDITPRVETTICLMRSRGQKPSRHARDFWEDLRPLSIPCGNE